MTVALTDMHMFSLLGRRPKDLISRVHGTHKLLTGAPRRLEPNNLNN